MKATGIYSAPKENLCAPFLFARYLKTHPSTLLLGAGGGGHPPGCLPTKPSVQCPSTLAEKWVEMRWAVMGDRLPADHNYLLYSALVKLRPQLKNVEWQLGTVVGIPDSRGWIRLGGKSHLMVRCNLANLEDFDFSIDVREEPTQLYDVQMKFIYNLNIFKTEFNDQDKVFIKEFLKVFYPTEYETAYKAFINKERLFTTLDNRQFLNSPNVSATRIFIGE